jgi:hypothetical protein
MNKQEIAENYINGNLDAVRGALIMTPGYMESLGRAFDVYQFIRGWYGASKALEFSNWLQKYSDLK